MNITPYITLMAFTLSLCSTQAFSQFAPLGTGSLEIFLTVEDPLATVRVSVDGQIVASDIRSTTNVCANTEGFDWYADTNIGKPVNGGCDDFTDRTSNQLYEFSFLVRRTQSSDVTYTYAYYNCDAIPSILDEKFYCLGNYVSENDLFFVLTSAGMEITGEGMSRQDDIVSLLNPNGRDWAIRPHKSAYCLEIPDQGRQNTCLNTSSWSVYLSNKIGRTFDLIDKEMINPAGDSWYFKNVTLNFYPGTSLVVDGSLTVDSDTKIAGGTISVENGGVLTLKGVLDIESNVVVSAGGTLEIESGSTVKLSSGAKIDVYGTIHSNSGVTLTNNGGSTKWKGITFWPGGSGSLFRTTIDKVDVGFGESVLTISSGNGNAVFITESNIYNNTGFVGQAISITGNSAPELHNNNIWSSKGHAIQVLSWSQPYLTNNQIEVTGSPYNYAVTAGSYAGPIFMNPGAIRYIGYNEISGTGRALRASGPGTVVNAGDGSSAMDNDFCTTGTVIIRSESSATVYAINDHWPNGSSSGLVELLTGGTAYTTPEASGNSICSGPSKMGPAIASEPSVVLDPDQEKFRSAASAYYVGDYASAASELTKLLNRDASTNVKVQAIAMLTRVAISNADETLLSFIDGIQSSTSEIEEMRLLALLHGYYMLGPEGSADLIYRTIMTGTHSADAMFDAGMERFYFLLGKGDFSAAESIYSSLKPATEDQMSRAAIARSFVGSLAKESISPTAGKQGPVANANTAISPSNVEISVYPNPFNPSTVFSFELQDSQYISLRVYDMLGREVAILADGQKSAGSYNLNFNASNLTTGTYVYRFRVGDEVKSGTLVLVR